MKKPIVVLDVDDVLFNLVPLWLDTLNSKYGTSVTPEDVTVWDMQKVFSSLTFKQIHEPLITPEFWESIQPIEGAVDGVQKLIDSGCAVYLCTATYYKNIPYKFAALEKWFPMIPRSRIIVSRDKSLFACDFMVDDAVHNLSGEHIRYKILVDAPYNQCGFDDNGKTKFRAKGWTEIVAHIEKCLEQERNDMPILNGTDFGQILICAVRYACGRRTYMPVTVINYIVPMITEISDQAICCMERDIRTAGYYGDDEIDKPDWMTFIGLLQAEIDKRGLQRW